MVESELLARLRHGDDEAYATIFREHYSWLVLTASRLLGDRSLAEEVVQDVMLELWRRRESLQVEQSFRAYLIRSTRNRALNHVPSLPINVAVIRAIKAIQARGNSFNSLILGFVRLIQRCYCLSF